jgi:hypothetical protein
MLFDDAFGIAPQELRSTRRIGGLLWWARFVAVLDGVGQHDIPPINPLQFKETTAPMSYKPVLRDAFVEARQARWDCSFRKAQCIPCRRGFALWSAHENKGGIWIVSQMQCSMKLAGARALKRPDQCALQVSEHGFATACFRLVDGCSGQGSFSEPSSLPKSE